MDLARLLDSQQGCIAHLKNIRDNVKKLATSMRTEEKLLPYATNAKGMCEKINDNHKTLLKMAGLPPAYLEKFQVARNIFKTISEFVLAYAPNLGDALGPLELPTSGDEGDIYGYIHFANIDDEYARCGDGSDNSSKFVYKYDDDNDGFNDPGYDDDNDFNSKQ